MDVIYQYGEHNFRITMSIEEHIAYVSHPRLSNVSVSINRSDGNQFQACGDAFGRWPYGFSFRADTFEAVLSSVCDCLAVSLKDLGTTEDEDARSKERQEREMREFLRSLPPWEE